MPAPTLTFALLASAACMAGAAQTDGQAPATQARRAYIVQLADAPLAAYTGGVPGLAPTIAQGQRLDTGSEAARRYTAYLEDKQRAVLALDTPLPMTHSV